MLLVSAAIAIVNLLYALNKALKYRQCFAFLYAVLCMYRKIALHNVKCQFIPDVAAPSKAEGWLGNEGLKVVLARYRQGGANGIDSLHRQPQCFYICSQRAGLAQRQIFSNFIHTDAKVRVPFLCLCVRKYGHKT